MILFLVFIAGLIIGAPLGFAIAICFYLDEQERRLVNGIARWEPEV